MDDISPQSVHTCVVPYYTYCTIHYYLPNLMFKIHIGSTKIMQHRK